MLGIYDAETKQIQTVEGRDLNEEVYTALEDRIKNHSEDKFHAWNHLRDGKSFAKESQSPSNPEKG